MKYVIIVLGILIIYFGWLSKDLFETEVIQESIVDYCENKCPNNSWDGHVTVRTIQWVTKQHTVICSCLRK